MFKELKEAFKSLALVFSVILFVSACSNGGSSSGKSDPVIEQDPDEISVTGSAVKGPMALADLTLYDIDVNDPDLKGIVIGTGTTDEEAQFQDLVINGRRDTQRFLLEVTSNADTVDLATCIVPGDLSTCSAPAISTLRTIISMPSNDGNIDPADKVVPTTYATPLSTFAVDVAAAVLNDAADSIAASDLDSTVRREINNAQDTVISAFGFGLIDDVDLFETSPTLADGDQEAAFNYRKASEAFAAIVLNIDEIAEADTNAVIRALAEDFKDGEFDGQADGEVVEGFGNISGTELLAELVPQNPDDLIIPGTNLPLSALADVISDELTSLGSTVEPDMEVLDNPPVIVPPTPGEDSDGDLVLDIFDACPNDPNETVDTDGDEVCDNSDAFPLDATEVADSDGDQIGDNADVFPFNALENADSDGDCTSLINPEYDFNAADAGNDCGDVADLFPDDASDVADIDLDGVGDNADACDKIEEVEVDGELVEQLLRNGYGFIDSDGDTFCAVLDGDDYIDDELRNLADYDDSNGAANDICADNSGSSTQEKIDAGCLEDDDNDGEPNATDLFPDNPYEIADSDGDCSGGAPGVNAGNGCADNSDMFPDNAGETADSDGDCDLAGTGTINNTNLNFGSVEQFAGASAGDGCGNNGDLFPLNPEELADTDGDCLNKDYNAYLIANNYEHDKDAEGYPNLVGSGDGCGDETDVFGPIIGNPDNDSDGVSDTNDMFPNNPAEFTDFDGDCNVPDVDYSTLVTVGVLDTEGDGCGDNSDPTISIEGTMTYFYAASSNNPDPTYGFKLYGANTYGYGTTGEVIEASVDYVMEVAVTGTTYTGSTVTLNGDFGTLGATLIVENSENYIPGFAQQHWTLTDTVLNNVNGVTQNFVITRGSDNAITSISGSLQVNSGTGPAMSGDSINNQPYVLGSPYVSGTIDCVGTGGTNASGSCNTFYLGQDVNNDADLGSHISFTATSVSESSMTLNVVSQTGNTGYVISTDDQTPAP